MHIMYMLNQRIRRRVMIDKGKFRQIITAVLIFAACVALMIPTLSTGSYGIFMGMVTSVVVANLATKPGKD